MLNLTYSNIIAVEKLNGGHNNPSALSNRIKSATTRLLKSDCKHPRDYITNFH